MKVGRAKNSFKAGLKMSYTSLDNMTARSVFLNILRAIILAFLSLSVFLFILLLDLSQCIYCDYTCINK